MSGHSKWATIKRQKGANDAKRGAIFTKLSKAVTIAVVAGGGIGDPSQNFRLRLAIDAARASNMPKENIQRAIERAAGREADVMEEVVYEGFAPGGISVVVEAATDNKNRTTGEVQNIFSKNGGSMGKPGSVAYQFTQMGQIIIHRSGKSLDTIFLDSADVGAEDLEEVGDEEVFVYTQPTLLGKVRDALQEKGYTIVAMELIRKANTPVSLTEEGAEKVIHFLEKLEEIDDVQKVYSNLG